MMSLLQMSFSGAVMIFAIITVRTLAINKLPKRVFLILWEIVLLRLLVPFSIPSALSAYSLLTNTDSVRVRETLTGISAVNDLVPQAAAVPLDINGGAAQVLQNEAPNVSVWLIVWIVGMLICAGYFMAAYLHCRSEFQVSLPVKNGFVNEWLKKHPLRRPIKIRQSGRISAPLTYGVLHPVILMPQNTDWENKQQLQYVLMHESMHIRRCDAVYKLIAALALCIHWFNPFVWVMYILYNRDIELACDESVVRQFGDSSKSAYARTLITMEETRSGLRPFCNNFSKTAIEERITAIMKTKKITRGILLISAALIIAIVVLFATSVKKEEPLPNNATEGNVAEKIEVPDGVPETSKRIIEFDESDNETRAQTTNIQYMLEGMPEQMPATLYVGDGFSIYIPDKDWTIYDEEIELPAQMTAVLSSEVSIWVERYENETFSSLEERLLSDGYVYAEDTKKMQKLDGHILIEARFIVWNQDVWAVFSMYNPAFDESGYEWGSRLDAIADTFAITENTEEVQQRK